MAEWVIDEVNGEIWCNTEQYGSREAAIAAGREEYDGDFYIGKALRYEPRVDADAFIERLQDDAYEEVGEVAEGWLDFKYDGPEVADLQKKLQAVFDEWLDAVRARPGFYSIKDVELIEGDR